MAITGSGGTFVFLKSESTYGTYQTPYSASGFKLAIRPGSIPSKNQQRLHARTLGSVRDVNYSYVTKSSVAGGYSFYLPTEHQLGNKIHKIAGVYDATPNNLPSLDSYSIHHPFTIKETGTDHFDQGFKYTGMVANQYSINLPGADSLIEANISFIGKDQDISLFEDPDTRTQQHTGSHKNYFETWNSYIILNPNIAVSGWSQARTIEIYNFGLTVSNNLVAPSFIDSSLTAINSKPQLTGRTVTGNFTMCYSDTSEGTDPSSIKMLTQLFTDNITTYSMDIYAYSSLESRNPNNTTGQLKISMPRIILEQSGTPNSISAGLMQVPFSFRAIGDPADPNGTDSNDSEIVVSQALV